MEDQMWNDNKSRIERDLCEVVIQSCSSYSDLLPIGFEVENAIATLEKNFELNWPNKANQLSQVLEQEDWSKNFLSYEMGMNSPGILWDRITILACKFALASSHSKHFLGGGGTEESSVLKQIEGVRMVLMDAMPPKSTLLAKEQTKRVSSAASISVSLSKLTMANLGMWVNQDLLYTRSVKALGVERLRSYILFFSRYNSARNAAIEEIDFIYKKLYGVIK